MRTLARSQGLIYAALTLFTDDCAAGIRLRALSIWITTWMPSNPNDLCKP
jgi:hypothetical protein